MTTATHPPRVMTWRALFESGEFRGADEARGALKLAVRQALQIGDVTVAEWTGLTQEEVGRWLLDASWLPQPSPNGSVNTSKAQPF